VENSFSKYAPDKGLNLLALTLYCDFSAKVQEVLRDPKVKGNEARI